jgi:hypothetical protein
LDLQELVEQLQFHERLVVTLVLLRQVQVEQLERQVLLQRAQALLLVVAP